MSSAVWDATNYQEQFDYVWQYGESLISQLAPQAGERILDLGCGTGQLTQAIATHGSIALGIDSDPAMIAQAKANYPSLSFWTDSADSFQLSVPVDAVFSNAVLHWVSEAEAAVEHIVEALKPGGRLVAELGGKGNVQTILTALEEVSGEANLNPWYFPGLGEYVALLEAAGLSVTYAHIFDRPTPLGASGLAGWLTMFGQRFFQHLSAEEWTRLVRQVETKVPQLYQDGVWVADYRRLRVIAIKV
ncbi:methyltransferase domain-containing protein [cf. Phormidesmis sp. LEGE 11477]|uniref:class I SAM-dependent methyltransferase n=1 Tax=cf. Phormidesmis sp. LEGE 11477 TaxID=1828680 RepID=UPI001881A975|nr:methyltransferase domain-containing protein [cf. Phormidesmis sp. LEGE 11477]MBE9060562.1 methyltransferase domain-containing protein [cf. Phormidesmis sp. LEGE 11477]